MILSHLALPPHGMSFLMVTFLQIGNGGYSRSDVTQGHKDSMEPSVHPWGPQHPLY
jgi:hypothetical protein